MLKLHRRSEIPRRRATDNTGSPKAWHYYRSSSQSASPSSSKKGKGVAIKTRLGHLIDWLVIGLVIVGLAYTLLVKPEPKVIMTSQAYHPEQTYRRAAISSLQSWRNHNKVTFDQSGLIKDLQNQFPEVERIDLELPLFSQRPLLRLNVSEPAIVLKSGSETYIVSSSGKAITNQANLSKNPKLVIVEDQSGFKSTISTQVMSAEEVNFITALQKQLAASRIPVRSLVLPAAAKELHLRTTDQPYFVKFYLGGDPAVQAGQLAAARQKFNSSSEHPSQYLDVRVEGKIFYR